MSNPLLESHRLPPFDRILPLHVLPAVESLIQQNEAQLQQLLAQTEYTWENLLIPLTDMNSRLHEAWSLVGHLHAVMSGDAMRKAYAAALPKITAYYLSLSQNTRLYQACQAIHDGDAFALLSAAAQENIRHTLRDFRLAGVALPSQQQAEFASLQAELAAVQTTFEEHVLDATDHWSLLIEDVTELKGLTEQALMAAQQAATAQGKTGYLLTLQAPSYLAVMLHAHNRKLRQTLYTAYMTRASDTGPHAHQFDNSPVMLRILEIRHALAELLQYPNYAAYALATRMAQSVPEVLEFLQKLVHASRSTAQQEYNALVEFAASEIKDFSPWDVAYYSEKMRQHFFNLAAEALRPYFPISQVLPGLFSVAERLFGITFHEKREANVWHPDVQCFELHNETGGFIGEVYLDLYARAQKRGGAWMDGCRTRRLDAQGQLHTPIAFLTCNFSAPQKGMPALLTHDEVITLFHEFGHGLHHLLTQIDVAGVAGINGVPWDAVEFPSQFFEHWCWEKVAIDEFARHYQSNEKLPDELFDSLIQTRHFQSALALIRQLEFSLFDFTLHAQFNVAAGYPQIQAALDEVRRTVSVIPPAAFNRFQHGFSHIFAGGYAAGYYSYQWAEVLACDAYTLFEAAGVFDKVSGRNFLQTILAQGGSCDPMVLFTQLMGRKPEITAFLRHHGIAEL